MASENAEKGTSSIGGTGTSYNGPSGGYSNSGSDYTSDRQPSNTSKAKTVDAPRSWFASLFGLGDDSQTSSDSTFAGATPAAKTAKSAKAKVSGYVTKYTQWRGVAETAAKISGIDESYFDRLIDVESKGKRTAHNPSGAAGLFQFMPKTAAAYGLKNPYDPMQSAVAVGKLSKDNFNYLSKKLGREPTQGEMYLAHQQGAGVAAKMLGHPGSLAKNLTSRENIRQNIPARSGFHVDSITASQFAGMWTSKFDGKQTAARRGGGAVQQDNNYGTNSFIAALMGGSPSVADVDATIQSIKAGEIGVDAGTVTGSTGTNTVAGGTGDDTISDKAGEKSAGVGIHTIMGDILNGNIGDAIAGLAGVDTSNVKGRSIITGIMDIFGIGNVAPGEGLATAAGSLETAENAGNWIYEYFLRIVIIILGLIFVAVGLAMFGKPIVQEVRRAL